MKLKKKVIEVEKENKIETFLQRSYKSGND